MWHKLAILLAVLVAVTGLAQLLGATNMGTALTFGQVAVVGTATLLILRDSSA
jgi:hypothetical protein